MTERMVKQEAWGYWEHVLANAAVAEKGHMACLDTTTALIVPGQTSANLIPIGTFVENVTGDGTKTVRIQLFEEVFLHWWDNDAAPNDVDASDIGNDVYIANSRTVSTLATGRSIAGKVYAIHPVWGVLVRHP